MDCMDSSGVCATRGLGKTGGTAVGLFQSRGPSKLWHIRT